ncbi:MAG: hypothetical protein ACP59X_04245 [Solidesulfovibrio sp. DCME]|uniref:hypothetical protein n=1 Tax=Solidesulfovibrio sp. DCME TaxID=3447380 RepID=UPI003D151047
MALRLASALLAITLFLGGCALFGSKAPDAPAAPKAMPLTAENVAQVRDAVAKAKAVQPMPQAPEAYKAYARRVYVDSWTGPWSPAATTDTALALAKAGSDPARQYLTIMVYDIQLRSAMEGTTLSAEDWRAVYVGSGIMTEAAFCGYVAMSRAGKVIP